VGLIRTFASRARVSAVAFSNEARTVSNAPGDAARSVDRMKFISRSISVRFVASSRSSCLLPWSASTLKIKAFLQTQNSPLATWLGCADLKAIWGKRDPSARKQYVPKGAGEEDSNNATELLKMRTLFRAILHDIGISPPTAYRNISNALKLVDRFGRPFVEQMLGRRIALDGHVLRDLVRLQDERQGRDVVHIYVEGAGETKAKRAIKAYLAAQAEKEREVAPMASQPAETGAPVAEAPSQQSPACAGLQGVTTRRLRLLRDGTVAEGVRVAEINDQEIVIEFVEGIHSATTAA